MFCFLRKKHNICNSFPLIPSFHFMNNTAINHLRFCRKDKKKHRRRLRCLISPFSPFFSHRVPWTLVPALVLLVPWAETAVYCPGGLGAGRLGVLECGWQWPVVLVVEGLQRHLPSGLQVVAYHVGQAACCPVPMDGAWGWCADAAEEEGEVGACHLVIVQQSCRHQAAVHISPVGPLVGVEAEVL